MSKLRGFVLASLGFVFFGIIPLMILVYKLGTMTDMTAWYNERLYIATVLFFMLGRCVCHEWVKNDEYPVMEILIGAILSVLIFIITGFNVDLATDVMAGACLPFILCNSFGLCITVIASTLITGNPYAFVDIESLERIQKRNGYKQICTLFDIIHDFVPDCMYKIFVQLYK